MAHLAMRTRGLSAWWQMESSSVGPGPLICQGTQEIGENASWLGYRAGEETLNWGCLEAAHASQEKTVCADKLDMACLAVAITANKRRSWSIVAEQHLSNPSLTRCKPWIYMDHEMQAKEVVLVSRPTHSLLPLLFRELNQSKEMGR
ncbi:MAG: hypothetical protein FRX49_07649 [Trebouxia sp. A1-2]|nr:MAG: hypothetical protein FRX49_07649 [Trebouxia sp. A1-2]